MEHEAETKYALRLEHITKTYPGVVALDDVSLDFVRGEVHALMGENGAGKSTLIKAISGAIRPDAGTICVDGARYAQMNPIASMKHGIAVIYQEMSLVKPLTVAENIYLGKHFAKLFSLKQLCRMSSELFDRYGFDLDPKARVIALPPASQQLVEVCKAIASGARIMIMDEPTAALATSEVEKLFEIIARLKAEGVTVVYISHRLDEVFEISGRISILRDGQFVTTLNTKETNREELISLMVGRALSGGYPKNKAHSGQVCLKLENVTGNSVRNISLELYRGEILGLAGLVGAGRTETAQLIAGDKKPDSGRIFVNGEEVHFASPNQAIAKGIGLIPEDRKQLGCILHNSVKFNVTLIDTWDYMKFGVINTKKRNRVTEDFRGKLRIKVPNIDRYVSNLSGGNQQKVVVAKTLAANLDIIIFDEPTKGIDVGAKQEIYELMIAMAAQGKAIIMISSDMEEILGMSDRILVLHEGEIAGELEKDAFSQENVLRLASGL